MTVSKVLAALAVLYGGIGIFLLTHGVPAGWASPFGAFALGLGVLAWRLRGPRPNWRAEEKAALKGSMDLQGLLAATPRVRDKR